VEVVQIHQVGRLLHLLLHDHHILVLVEKDLLGLVLLLLRGLRVHIGKLILDLFFEDGDYLALVEDLPLIGGRFNEGPLQVDLPAEVPPRLRLGVHDLPPPQELGIELYLVHILPRSDIGFLGLLVGQVLLEGALQNQCTLLIQCLEAYSIEELVVEVVFILVLHFLLQEHLLDHIVILEEPFDHLNLGAVEVYEVEVFFGEVIFFKFFLLVRRVLRRLEEGLRLGPRLRLRLRLRLVDDWRLLDLADLLEDSLESSPVVLLVHLVLHQVLEAHPVPDVPDVLVEGRVVDRLLLKHVLDVVVGHLTKCEEVIDHPFILQLQQQLIQMFVQELMVDSQL